MVRTKCLLKRSRAVCYWNKCMHATARFFVSSLLVWLVTAAPVFAQGNPITIDTPRSGWRTGDRDNAGFSQPVNYPASSVTAAENQAETARIRGRIANLPKQVADASSGKGTPPATLIVNGVAMPLKLDESGAFDRPYIFPGGSNSVEVRSPDSGHARRLQFHDGGLGGTPARLRVVLTWDSDNTDLDLHVITPDGAHAWYGERALANGGAIDVDVTTGYGPEIFASPTPLSGQYQVYVNYFGGGYYHDEESDTQDVAKPLTVATVTLIFAEGTPDERQQSFSVPMRAPGELTLVKGFSYP